MQYRTSHATPDTEAGAIYAGQLSLVHTGSMALIGVCSRHTPDPAPRGTSQVGGAAGFLAAQSGPPSPGGAHGTSGQSCDRQQQQ